MPTVFAPPTLGHRRAEEFFRRGWCVLPGVFSQHEIRQMRQAFDRLERMAEGLPESGLHRGSQFVLDRERGDVRIHRVVWCGAAEPDLLRFGADPRLLHAAGDLLGTRLMNHLINQAHFKRPDDGVLFPWHQDSTHRRYGEPVWRDVNGRGSYVQTVTALDDMCEENGGLRFIPGSCQLGHLGQRTKLPPELLRRAVGPEVEAGSVILFGPYTLHSSGPNRTHQPRRAFINGYACPGANTRVYPGEGAGRLLSVE